MKYRIILFFLLINVLFLSAQNTAFVDSLKLKLYSEGIIQNKIKLSKLIFDELMKGNIKEAENFVKSEMKLAEKLDSPLLKIYALNHYAVISNFRGQYDLAVDYLNQAIDISDKNKFEYEKYLSLLNLAETYQKKEQLNKSAMLAFDLLKYFEGGNYKEELAKAYVLIANSFVFRQNYNKGLDYYQKALELYKEIGNKKGEAETYNSLATLWYYQGQYEKAATYVKQSLRLARELNDKNLIRKNLFVLSLIKSETNQTDKSIELIKKTIDIDKQLENHFNLVGDYDAISTIYLKADSIEKAAFYVEKAYNLAQNYKIGIVQYGLLTNMIDIYYKKKNYKKAIESYMQREKIIEDYFPDKSNEVSDFDLQYNINKQDEKYLTEFKKIKIKTFIYITLLTLLILLLIIVLLLVRIRLKKNRQKREDLKRIIEQKDKELASYILNLANKNELGESVLSKLKELRLKLNNKEQISIINSMINEIQLSSIDDIWEEFEIRFQDVHKSFYEKLAKDYPELTTNERRLAALIKLNMTTKEISRITLKSVSAIEVARTRLRKKLGINKQKTDLASFFSQL